MDYGQGTQLVKEQWSGAQTGQLIMSLFDSEEDGQYYASQAADNITLFETLKQIKRCYNQNTSMSISQLPNTRANMFRIEKAFIAGIQYDYIYLYKDVSGDQSSSINPKNNVTSQEKYRNQEVAGSLNYGLISVNNSIYIEVPPDRRVNMELYLKSPEGKNLILFVNGYRSNISLDFYTDFPNSMNKIHSGDVYSYWPGIDAEFMTHIGTRTAVYADGHHSVGTSNHESTVNYLGGNILSKQAKIGCLKFGDGPICHTNGYLHRTPNTAGFLVRQTNGEQAGTDLINRISSGSVVFNKLTDTLDIVAHSMGYAYAVGMIKKLDLYGIKFGRFYILAPENACSGGADWSKFKEVWQYGTNEAIVEPYLQDGVAPQCLVKNLDQLTSSTKGGRVYIPYDYWPKGYLESHTVKNYDWIFQLQSTRNGYVKQR